MGSKTPIIVHPICRGLPHFALPLLLVRTSQPSREGTGWCKSHI
jgi:hypothetical protein